MSQTYDLPIALSTATNYSKCENIDNFYAKNLTQDYRIIESIERKQPLAWCVCDS